MNEIREPSLDSRIRQMISVAAKTRDGHWRLFFNQGTASYFTDFFCTSHLFEWLFGAIGAKKTVFLLPLLNLYLHLPRKLPAMGSL